MTKVDETKHEKVHMACRRGTDRLTKGQSCDGRTAYKLTDPKDPPSKAPAFKCAKCGFEWVVPTGGSFNVV
jgi:hypothetical protein